MKLKTSFIFKEIWIDSKDNEVVRGYDGMVYIADLKSVPFEGCGFESHYPHWAHRNLYKSRKYGASLKIGHFKDKTSVKTHWVVWVKIFLSNTAGCGGNLAKEYILNSDGNKIANQTKSICVNAIAVRGRNGMSCRGSRYYNRACTSQEKWGAHLLRGAV